MASTSSSVAVETAPITTTTNSGRAWAERPTKRNPFVNMAVESKVSVCYNSSELARLADDLREVERRIYNEADGDELDLLYARKACLEQKLAGF